MIIGGAKHVIWDVLIYTYSVYIYILYNNIYVFINCTLCIVGYTILHYIRLYYIIS